MGRFKHGEFHGQGKFIYSNKDVLEGEFEAGVFVSGTLNGKPVTKESLNQYEE